MSPQTAARWTQIVAVFSFLTAVLMAVAAHPPFSNGLLSMFDLVDWPVDGDVTALTDEARLLAAVGGGIFAGFSAMFMFIVAPALRRGDDEIRKGALYSLLVWFVIDSTASVAAGAPGNVIGNTLYLAALGAPLVLAAGPAGARAKTA